MNPNTLLMKTTGISWQYFEDGLIILNPNKEKVHQLNHTARFLFESIDGVTTIGELKQKFANHFEVTPESIEQDVYDFIIMAQEWKIIQ